MTRAPEQVECAGSECPLRSWGAPRRHVESGPPDGVRMMPLVHGVSEPRVHGMRAEQRAGGRLALANSHTADTAVSSKNQGRIPAALYPGRQLDDSWQCRQCRHVKPR